MKTVYICACSGLIGLAAGFACGYFYSKKHTETEFKDKYITYKTEMEYYRDKYREERREHRALQREVADTPIVDEEDEEDEEEFVRETFGKNNKTEYHKFSVVRTLDQKMAEEAMHVDNPPTEEEGIRPPYLITDEDFQVDYPYVTSSTISYYPGDGIFADERGERITEPIKIVGDDAIEKAKNCSDECLYVHNEELGVNFCIVIEHGLGYMKDYLGYDDSEEE